MVVYGIYLSSLMDQRSVSCVSPGAIRLHHGHSIIQIKVTEKALRPHILHFKGLREQKAIIIYESFIGVIYFKLANACTLSLELHEVPEKQSC